ncbi:MAG: BREX-3 system P-loop-containing protein BrxF [Methanomicrobiales archaeon]|nr:BREX-3 system P-loop-containing protein BrxF [Methanomicrobiales archaeon]
MPPGLSPVAVHNMGGLNIVVGLSGTGKTSLLKEWAGQYGYPYINIGSLVSQRALGYSRSERPNAIQHEFLDAIEKEEGDVILCDNIELLFAPELLLDPLRLLKQAARRKTVVAAWSGTYDGSTLSYATPGHDEYRVYSCVDTRGITLLSTNEANFL